MGSHECFFDMPGYPVILKEVEVLHLFGNAAEIP